MSFDDDGLDGRVAALDLAQKVRLLTGASMFTLHGEPGVGLAAMSFSDGPTGVRGLDFAGGPQVSLLPNATLLASAWNEAIATEAGRILAEEAQRLQIHVVLGPTINLHRSPLGGRLFEAYSEDPLLSGRLAAAYVRGLQEAGVAACLKHLVANESETERNSVDIQVDEATLRELYLLPFEIAVADSRPWAVMAAYNDVNGIPATEHDQVLNSILKGGWDYDGLVMSDWFATKSAGEAALGGLDLVMPGPDGPWGADLVAAVEHGRVPEAVIDDHVRRLLLLAGRVGALDAPRRWPTGLPAPDSEPRREQLVRLAVGGMTVLTNNGVLPLRRGERVALIGRHALETVGMGGGSAEVNPPYQISVAEGLRQQLDDDVTVVDGVEVRRRVRPARLSDVVDPHTQEPGLRLRLRAADGRVLVDEKKPSPTVMVDPPGDTEEPAVMAELSATVRLHGRVELGVLGAGTWRVRCAGVEQDVVLTGESADPGESVLRPPGWVTEVDVAEGADVTLVAEVDLAPGWFGRLGLAARPANETDESAMEKAVEAAASAAVAVLVVGLTEEQETEAVDKFTLALPGAQDELVRRVAAVAPRTVVVVNAATPVLMPWLETVDAVLWAGIPGQEAGHAVAAALLNVIEPSGRLVTTFPAADGDSPAWGVTPDDGVLVYAEGPFIGYGGYDAGRAGPPAFWFGHGLGYGRFEYGEPRLASADTEAPVVEVEISNTSQAASREVVQVYLRPVEDDRPIRLVGWTALDVQPGGTAQVRVRCDARLWRRWDTESGRWASVRPGGELVLARGLGDVRGRVRLPEA